MVISPTDNVIRPKKVVTLPVDENKPEKTVATAHQENENTLPEVSTASAMTLVDEEFDYERIIRKFIGNCGVVRGKNGKVYLQWNDMGNHYHEKVGSNFTNLYLRRQAIKEEITLRDKDLKEINDMIRAFAEIV